MLITTMLAQTDGEILRVIREPGFADFVVYAFVSGYIIEKVYNWFTRGKPNKTIVTGSLETSEAFKPADAKDVAEMKRQIDGLRQEQEAMLNAALKAGENRVTDLSKVMDRETAEIKERVDSLEEKLLDKLERISGTITDKISGLAVEAAKHGASIPDLDRRISELSQRYNEAIPRIHSRIDDAMKKGIRS